MTLITPSATAASQAPSAVDVGGMTEEEIFAMVMEQSRREAGAAPDTTVSNAPPPPQPPQHLLAAAPRTWEQLQRWLASELRPLTGEHDNSALAEFVTAIDEHEVSCAHPRTLAQLGAG
jgi:hypothetical protein